MLSTYLLNANFIFSCAHKYLPDCFGLPTYPTYIQSACYTVFFNLKTFQPFYIRKINVSNNTIIMKNNDINLKLSLTFARLWAMKKN